MSGPDVMFPEEQQQMALVCARLARDANAKAVLLIGRDGQPIADAGDVDELDVTSLSSLTAGNVAATGGIAKILREKDFSSQFHEGEKTNIHITLVGRARSWSCCSTSGRRSVWSACACASRPTRWSASSIRLRRRPPPRASRRS